MVNNYFNMQAWLKNLGEEVYLDCFGRKEINIGEPKLGGIK
jgi:hypothetical protein